jgi:ParB/RepB/Spo0J family partition protein
MGLSRDLMEKLIQGYRPPSDTHFSPSRSASNQPTSPVATSPVAAPPSVSSSRLSSDHESSPVVEMVAHRASLQWLSPEVIEPNPLQPRLPEEQQAVDSLRESLAACGQIVPAVVRRLSEGEKPYRLIEGHRRWEAIRQLNQDASAPPRQLLCYVVECTPSEEAVFVLAANLNRQEFRYLSLAYAMRQIVESGVSQKELGVAIGWDPAAISRCLRLTRLPADTLSFINTRRWSFRKLSLTIDACLRQGRVLEEITPEDLLAAAAPQTSSRRWRFSITLPPDAGTSAPDLTRRQALTRYYSECATGARELWNILQTEATTPLPLEEQIAAVLSPALAILRREVLSAGPVGDASPEFDPALWLREKFMQLWEQSATVETTVETSAPSPTVPPSDISSAGNHPPAVELPPTGTSVSPAGKHDG